VRKPLKPAAGRSAILKHSHVLITGAAPGIMSAGRWGTLPVQLLIFPARTAFFARRTIPGNQGEDSLPRVYFLALRQRQYLFH